MSFFSKLRCLRSFTVILIIANAQKKRFFIKKKQNKPANQTGVFLISSV